MKPTVDYYSNKLLIIRPAYLRSISLPAYMAIASFKLQLYRIVLLASLWLSKSQHFCLFLQIEGRYNFTVPSSRVLIAWLSISLVYPSSLRLLFFFCFVFLSTLAIRLQFL